MNKRTSMKLLIALVVLAMAMGMVSKLNAQEPVTIRFFHKWPEPEPMAYFQDVIAKFEAANPNIKVSMEAVADEPYKDKIRAVMASGDVPDIYFSWAGEFSWKFAREGRALELDKYFNDTEWAKGVIASTVEPYKWDGHLYGIPLRMNAKFMVYNKALFEQYKLAEPKTWDEFLKVCETLKSNGVVPIAFGNEFPWASSHYMGTFNAQLVPADVRTADYLLTADDAKLFTDPGYVEAANRFKLLGDKGYFNDGANAIQHSLARSSFIAGQAGMMYVELEEFVTVANGMGKDAFGFFALPGNPDDKGDAGLLTGAPDGFMVSADTKHPEEAIAFLKFLTSQEEGAAYVKTLGIPSSVVGAVNDNTALPIVVAGVDRVNEAKGMALWLDTDINIKIVEVYLPGMQALLTGSETPESLMQKVHDAAVTAKTELAAAK